MPIADNNEISCNYCRISAWKKLYPISYDRKIDNFLDYINYTGEISTLDCIKSINEIIDSLETFHSYDRSIFNESEEMFRILDSRLYEKWMKGFQMKIAYLMRFWPVYGGGETVTRILANELTRRDHDVAIIYLWERHNRIAVEIDKRIQEIKLNGIYNKNDGDIKKKDYKVMSEQLARIFSEQKFDVIVNQWLPSRLVYQAAEGTGAKVIKCHHGVVKYVPVIKSVKQKIFYGIFGEKGGWLRVHWQRKEDYLYSDKWVFLSDAFVSDAKVLLRKADGKKLCAIPNPLHYQVDSHSIDLDKKQHRLLYVGRMIELKRVHFLLDAWKQIEETEGTEDWDFVLVGDGVSLEDEKAYAERLGCKRVVFTGFQNPVPYYKDAAILAMASNSEGFGMVLVEAQQYGCVPIALDSFSTVHDIIAHEKNGILADDNDLDDFCSKLLILMKDKEKRNALAENAMMDCEKFSLKNIVDRWEQLFQEVVS